ncbi:MAG TPA: hypothetical protein VMI33_22520 [Streptosporangiaceae bacterium]|nr:hypothetical protein [Streptosporangiaceae bacterium]
MRIPPQVTERVKEAPAQALRAVFSGIGQVLLVADRIKNRVTEPPRAEPGVPPRTSSGPGPGAPAKSETRWRSLDETGNVRLLSEEDAPAPVAEAAGEPVPAEDVATTEKVEVAEDIAPAEVAEEAEVAEDIAPTEVAEEAEVAEDIAPIEVAEEIELAEVAEVAEEIEEAEVAEAEVSAGETPPAAEEAPATAEKAPAPAPASDLAALPVPNYDELTVASLRARLRNLDSSQVRALLDHEKANAGRPAVLTMFERRIAKLDSGEA